MFSKFSKSFLKGLQTFFTTERIVVLVIFLVLIFALASYSNMKTGSGIERMETGEPAKKEEPALEQMTAPNGYASQSVANPSDLLPKDENSEFAALNPTSMNKGDVLMPDLLQAGHHVGVDTVGQSLRNANLQLRSDPVITKSDVGPWNNTTIEPDLGRVPLELGAKNPVVPK
tara:strand:- start:4671 stop:5189 length:519 start_codon:yes stop_codon:yes gene_type:complete